MRAQRVWLVTGAAWARPDFKVWYSSTVQYSTVQYSTVQYLLEGVVLQAVPGHPVAVPQDQSLQLVTPAVLILKP